MAWKTELNEDLSTLQVLCRGRLSADDLTMLAIETTFLAQEHGCRKILVDLAEVSLDFPVGELCELLDSYAEYRLSQATRTGVVLGPMSRPQDLSQVLTAAKGYGYQVEVLTGEQSKAWLSS